MWPAWIQRPRSHRAEIWPRRTPRHPEGRSESHRRRLSPWMSGDPLHRRPRPQSLGPHLRLARRDDHDAEIIVVEVFRSSHAFCVCGTDACRTHSAVVGDVHPASCFDECRRPFFALRRGWRGRFVNGSSPPSFSRAPPITRRVEGASAANACWQPTGTRPVTFDVGPVTSTPSHSGPAASP